MNQEQTPQPPLRSDSELLDYMIENPACAAFLFTLIPEEKDIEVRKGRVRRTLNSNIEGGLRDRP